MRMRGILLIAITGQLCLLGPNLSFGQQLNVENVFNSQLSNNTEHGINAAYMFHHVLDANYELSPAMEAAIIGTNYDVVRFPGGAIGNYYRFNGPGYGALKSEVGIVANTVNCNGTGTYCFTKDEFAPRNFIYDFIDLMESKHAVTGEGTDILYMLNLLLHFVYNYNQIPALETIDNLNELDAALAQGAISQDFHTRIMENYNAMTLLHQQPNINITGIEMGNEFYFYQEVTTFPYPPTNSNPFFNLNSALNTIQPRMARYLTLVKFYTRLMHAVDPGIKIGVPIGGINHLGSMANADELWNTAVKQWIIQDVDALIPHLYIKTEAPEVDPPTAAASDDNSDIVAIKKAVQNTLETKFVGILREIAEFFALDSDYRELWMTEYNVNKNESASQIWDEWTNTYLHGAFLSELMKLMTTSQYAHYLHYAILHGWSGGEPSYEHCLLTRKNDGTIIKRMSHFINEDVAFLKSPNTVLLNGTVASTIDPWDLYTEAHYTYDSSGDDCPVERFILSFTNLRADNIPVNLNFGGGQLILNGKTYTVTESRLIGSQGIDLSSSCGRTEFSADENNYDISSLDYPVDISAPVTIPSYTTGYLELTIEPVNNDCLPLALDENSLEKLTLSIFPNPVADQLRVQLPEEIRSKASHLSIANSLGQEVRRISISTAEIQVDVRQLERGIYFIHAITGSSGTRPVPFIRL